MIRFSFISFLRNKFFIISASILFVFINAFNINSILIETDGYINFLSHLPSYAIVFLIYFLLVSYEMFSRSRQQNFEEVLVVSATGKLRFAGMQIIVLVLLNLLFTMTIIMYNFIFIAKCNAWDTFYALHIVQNTILNFTFVCLLGILIGAMFAQFSGRLTAYLSMTVFVFLTSEAFKNISRTLDIYDVFEFFNIYWVERVMPNHSFGIPLLDYRFARIGIFAFISLGLLLWKLFDKKKKACVVSSIICIALVFSSTFIYMQPISKMDRNEYYLNEDYNYYNMPTESAGENPVSIEKQEVANFKVKQYDMELDVRWNLKAIVTITPDKSNLKEYRFTLYHGYNVKNVQDQNSDDIPFIQNGDYILITPTSEIEKIQISYEGSSPSFYSNKQGTYLSGAFPYYPHPGYNRITNDVSGGNDYIEMPYQGSTTFKVKVTGNDHKMYSNLSQEANVFSGISDFVSLYSGPFLSEKMVEGIRVIYPYLADELLNDEIIINETKLLKESMIKRNHPIKTVFSVPNIMKGSNYTFTDYIEYGGMIGIVDGYEKGIINSHKRDLYIEAYIIYLQDRGNFDMFVNEWALWKPEWEGDTQNPYDYDYLFHLFIEKYGEEEGFKRLDDYLFSDEDTRSIEQFYEDEMGKTMEELLSKEVK